MSDYTRSSSTFFGDKDSLPSGNANKVIKGSEFDTEFNAIVTAIATKYDSDDRNALSGIAGVDADGYVTDSVLPPASETVAGVAEYATSAEATALTATDKTITPATLNAVLAASDGTGITYASGVFTFDPNSLAIATIAAGDFLSFADIDASNVAKKITFANLEAALTISNLTGYNANAYVDHTGVTLTAGSGLTGGGTIAASRTFNVGAGTGIAVNTDDVALDISGLTAMTAPSIAVTDGFLVDDGGTMKRLSYQESHLVVNDVAGTTDTLADADCNTVIRYTSATAVTVTVNTGVGGIGSVINVLQWGAGQVTISAGTATVQGANGLKTRAQYSMITLVQVAADTWVVCGDSAT